ncbi:MAG: ABC transporter ATP-binding protein [Candidatus Berkiella sp.]
MNAQSNDLLRVNNLSMHFSGLKALNNVSLSVKEGSISAIIGPNGAGKTTLFNCLTGFYIAQKGELLFKKNNQFINLGKLLGESFSARHLKNPISFFSTLYYNFFGGSHLVARAGISRTFQNIRLFREMTVIENLMVAQFCHTNRHLVSGYFNTKSFQRSEKDALSTAYAWLDKFHLTDDANRLAGMLPYGKQRHLEIARSMCTRPHLLCLDEPAAGLNPQETNELREIILSLRQNESVTILLIEHDMSLVMKISDHIVVLDHGEVICTGNPSDVRRDKRVIQAYLGVEND